MTDTQPRMLVESLSNPTAFPITAEQRDWMRCRPPAWRTSLPEPGQRVRYRHNHGESVVSATILEVNMSDPGDYGVWRFVLDAARRPLEVDGKRVMELVDDPWPTVILDTPFGRIMTRESRISGSAGWLPTFAPHGEWPGVV